MFEKEYVNTHQICETALKPVSMLEMTRQKIRKAEEELERLKELEKLLEANPETQRIIELMRY